MRIMLESSSLVPIEDLTIVEMNRETAVKLIHDLVQELSKTGLHKEIFRSDEKTSLVFKVKD